MLKQFLPTFAAATVGWRWGGSILWAFSTYNGAGVWGDQYLFHSHCMVSIVDTHIINMQAPWIYLCVIISRCTKCCYNCTMHNIQQAVGIIGLLCKCRSKLFFWILSTQRIKIQYFSYERLGCDLKEGLRTSFFLCYVEQYYKRFRIILFVRVGFKFIKNKAGIQYV